MSREIGCTRCPAAGHIELKECPDAYTERAPYCGLYNHAKLGQDTEKKEENLGKFIEYLNSWLEAAEMDYNLKETDYDKGWRDALKFVKEAYAQTEPNAITELEKVRDKIAEYGSIYIRHEYRITGNDREDIKRMVENAIGDVVPQAKQQVVDMINNHISELKGGQK